MTSAAAGSTHASLTEDAPEQRRTLAVLLLAQILSGAGLAAGITVGALLAEQMLGSSSLSGLPTVFFTIGSAAAAIVLGRAQPALRPSRGTQRGLPDRRHRQRWSRGRGQHRQPCAALRIAAGLRRWRRHESAGPLRGSRSRRTLPSRAGGQHRAGRHGSWGDPWPQSGRANGRGGRQLRRSSPCGSVHACCSCVRVGGRGALAAAEAGSPAAGAEQGRRYVVAGG